jgi:hypothetical protein
VADINEYVNGQLHGQVHIMTGGHWQAGAPDLNISDGAQAVLLSSKYLWRQGLVRCPSYCGADTPAADCACSCPAALLSQVVHEVTTR